ncbi:MAG TPA: methyltransferase domain-containing protein [Candidatus Baltobacteraceae bacterium]|jgi:glycosyltransferase involved in cell wall biosynthesis
MPPGRQRFSLFHRSAEQDNDFKLWHHTYVEALTTCTRVLDFGCGTGVFLELLRERGISGVGIDHDPDMVKQTRERGLEAILGDAQTVLQYEQDFDGIHVAHVLETMWGDEVVEFLRACKRALKPDGLLVLRAWNWENPEVRDRLFWFEISHKRPYPLVTLREALKDLEMHVISAGYEPAGQKDTYCVARAPYAPLVDKLKPSRERPLLVWEGELQTLNSMSIINRELGRILAASADLQVVFRPDEAQAEPFVAADPRFEAMRARIDRTPVASDVFVRHPCGDPSFERPPTERYVQIQPWEYGALPARWVSAMRQSVDEVWCPSNYVRDLYLAAGFDPANVLVVPNGVDPDIFSPGEPGGYDLGTKKSFKFLFIGGTLERKGIDVLLDAYLAAFRPDDDVTLIVKDFGLGGFYRMVTQREKIFAAQRQPGSPEIVYNDRDLTMAELIALYRSCDCLAFPYRGEGFGMPILEAMACGLPVIVTAGGAADDFLDDSTAYRIPARRRSIGDRVYDVKLCAEGWLLEPDRMALAQRMRHLYEHRDEGREVGARASARARTEFTWQRAADRVVSRVRELRSGAVLPTPAP